MSEEEKKKVSAAKRAANDKWDKANMNVISCKLKKEYAEAFKQYAEEQTNKRGKRTTPSALIREYIYSCIGKEISDTDSED